MLTIYITSKVKISSQIDIPFTEHTAAFERLPGGKWPAYREL